MCALMIMRIYILTQLSTKSLIAQDIATYEGLYKITHLLDQFCNGLKKAGILEIIRVFPDGIFVLICVQEADCCGCPSCYMYASRAA